VKGLHIGFLVLVLAVLTICFDFEERHPDGLIFSKKSQVEQLKVKRNVHTLHRKKFIEVA